MIRQTRIPNSFPGEPITQSLINQLVKGANTARVAVGDPDTAVNVFGGIMGISNLTTPPNGDKQTILMVQSPTSSASDSLPALGGGFYWAKIYYQEYITAEVTSDSVAEAAQPDITSCIVLDLAGWGKAGHSLSSDRAMLGRQIGFTTGGIQLFAVDTGKSGGYALVKSNGTSGGRPTYDLYDLADIGFVTKLNNSGPLVPTCSRARWTATVTVTAASDGSVASIFYDTSDAIQLFDLPEFVVTGTCSSSGGVSSLAVA